MVGTSRNTRRSSRSNRCNPHNAIKLLIQPTEPCKELLRFRIAFSEYLQSSSESVSEPCFFTIRGRHRWGLSLHLGITTRQYSALLLACDLVSTSKATNGASSVSCSETVWREDFLKRYGLLFVDTKGHCEITRAKVRYKYLEDDDGRSIRPTTKTADTMHLLRIGKYKDRGETVTAIRQIHSDQPPASFNNKQRTAQRRLFNDIRDDFSKYLFDNRIDDVMSWVEMTDVFNPTNSDEEDDDDSSDSSDEMEEKIPTVKDDDDIEKKPPAVKDGGDNGSRNQQTLRGSKEGISVMGRCLLQSKHQV